jgi:hypothetical protein
MLNFITNATACAFEALFYASFLLWCSCLGAVGGLCDFAIWHGYPFLCLLQGELENFVLPPEECSPYAEMATSGDQIPCLYASSRFTIYRHSGHFVSPDFWFGNFVHLSERPCYVEPVEEKVVYRLPSSITRDVRQVAGSSPSDNEDSTESDGQVVNECDDDPMDVDEVDPCCDPMDIEPWNWNLDWSSGNEQFNFEFVLPRANFVGTGVVFAGQTHVEEDEHVVPDIINDPIPVGDEARELPVHAPALDTPQVLPTRPQRAAEAVLDDDHDGENEDVLAEILGDLF